MKGDMTVVGARRLRIVLEMSPMEWGDLLGLLQGAENDTVEFAPLLALGADIEVRFDQDLMDLVIVGWEGVNDDRTEKEASA